MSEPQTSSLNVRNPRAELSTESIGIKQKPNIEGRADLDNQIVTAGPGAINRSYQDELAFGEDPVTIRLERSGEKNAPQTIPCWVNGKGAEVEINGRWVELGYLPVGVILTTKRKYVEVLARSKVDNISTKVAQLADSERNEIERSTHAHAPFSVIKDANPRGAEWLTNLVRYL